MNCKIFFYENDNDWKKILTHLENIKEDHQLITTSLLVNEFLKKNGKDSIMLEEIFPVENKKTYELNSKIMMELKEYENIFSNFFYKKYKIFNSIENQILKELILFHRIKKILENNINTIFIFNEFYFSFFILIDSIQNKNLKSNSGIYQIKGDTLVKTTQNNYPQSRGKKIGLLQKFLIKNKKEKNKSTNLTLKIKHSKTKLIQNYIFYKWLPLKTKKKKNHLLKILYNKTKPFLLSNPKCIFILTIQRDDLAQGFNVIFQNFIKNKIPFNIITFDLVSTNVLSKLHLPFLDLFEESYFLAELIKKSEEGKHIVDILTEFPRKSLLPLMKIKEYQSFLLNEIFRSISIMEICEYLFSQTKLKSVVISEGSRNGNSVIPVTKNFGITSFCIPLLLISPDPLYSKLYPSDKICIYGTQGQQSLKTLGYSENNIILTGNPKFDELTLINPTNAKNLLFQKFRIDPKKKLIVIAMSRWQKNDELWISNIIRFCNKNNFEVFIKIHPVYTRTMIELNEKKIKSLKKICKKENFVVSADIDIPVLLASSDLVITSRFSTIAIESSLLKKPVISFNHSHENYDFMESYHVDTSIFLNDYDQLEKYLKEILVEKKHSHLIDNGFKLALDAYNIKNDGKASQRITNLLIQRD